MFIDIGNGTIIQTSKIIAMIDYELVSSSGLLKEMEEKAKETNILIDRSDDETKSLIVTTESVYLSSLSVPTLKKRTSVKAALKNLEDYSESTF